jgi:hypothetical protein
MATPEPYARPPPWRYATTNLIEGITTWQRYAKACPQNHGVALQPAMGST